MDSQHGQKSTHERRGAINASDSFAVSYMGVMASAMVLRRFNYLEEGFIPSPEKSRSAGLQF